MININPFIDLISSVIYLYKLILTLWIIISWLVAFDIINTYQPFVKRLLYFLNRLVEPVLSYLRRYIPTVAGIDLSAIVLFLLLGFLNNALYTYFYTR